MDLEQIFLQAFGPQAFQAFLDTVQGTASPLSDQQLGQEFQQQYQPFFKKRKDELIQERDKQLSRGKQDLKTELQRLALQEQRTGQDASTALKELARQRGFTQQDYNTAVQRLQQERQFIAEDLNRTLTAEGLGEEVKRDRELAGFNQNLQGTFGSPLQRRQEEQRQQLRQLDLQNIQDTANRQQLGVSQQLQDLKTNLGRAMGSYTNQENNIYRQRNRATEDYTTNRSLANRAYGRQAIDIGDVFRKNSDALTQEQQQAQGDYYTNNRFRDIFSFF